MMPWDKGGDNQSVTTREGDNTFQPIRVQHSGHVIKTNNMANCHRRVGELRTTIFKLSLLFKKKNFTCQALGQGRYI